MPSQDPSLPAGYEIGEYRVERELGRGGMGTVYAAVHPLIGRRVAIKVLSAFGASSPDLVERFVSEARASSRIGHPNIINVFAFGQLDDGRHYFVMEYLEGETLEQRMARGRLPARQALHFLTQICQALAAAHEAKIIHRDLKPENIWIATPRHAEPFVKLLDFGIAKLVDNSRGVTHTGIPIGTPLYMAPEQCLGRPVDERTDLYALGVILFRLFTGRLPFEGATYAEVVTQHLTQPPPAPSSLCPMDGALNRLVLRCLEKDPTLRPQSALEVASQLWSVTLPEGEVPGPGRPATPSGTTDAPVVSSDWPKHAPVAPIAAPRRAAVVLLGLAVLGGLGALAALHWPNRLVSDATTRREPNASATSTPEATLNQRASAAAPPPSAHVVVPAPPLATAPATSASANAGKPLSSTGVASSVPTPQNLQPKPAERPLTRGTKQGLETNNPYPVH